MTIKLVNHGLFKTVNQNPAGKMDIKGQFIESIFYIVIYTAEALIPKKILQIKKSALTLTFKNSIDTFNLQHKL